MAPAAITAASTVGTRTLEGIMLVPCLLTELAVDCAEDVLSADNPEVVAAWLVAPEAV